MGKTWPAASLTFRKTKGRLAVTRRPITQQS